MALVMTNLEQFLPAISEPSTVLLVGDFKKKGLIVPRLSLPIFFALTLVNVLLHYFLGKEHLGNMSSEAVAVRHSEGALPVVLHSSPYPKIHYF